MIVHYKKHPVWNKHLTKKDHQGIAKYAVKRRGENNPIHKTTHEQRVQSNYLNVLKREGRTEELNQRLKNYSLKSKGWFERNYEKYQIKFDSAREKLLKNSKIGTRKYYEKYSSLGIPAPNKISFISKPELIIKEALSQLCVEFKHQFWFKRHNYDFFYPVKKSDHRS